ncbi:DUF2877 domain-containing protein [Monashia sp. NPDC004114]
MAAPMAAAPTAPTAPMATAPTAPTGSTALRALTADAALLGLIRSGRFAGTVHSTFASVVNLRTTKGDLFSVAARHVDNAPNTVVVDVTSLSHLRAPRGATVVSHGSGLACPARFTIDVANASPWTPTVPDLCRTARSDGLAQLAAELGRVIDRDGRPGGIRPRDGQGTIDARVSRALQVGTNGLVRALAQGDRAAATLWGGRVIGLGPGLTPSGDDFVTGLAAMVAAPGTRIHALGPWLRRLVWTHRTRTNVISWTAMHEAARGRVRESLIAVLDAVAAGDAGALHSAARRVITIGNTSGTDIVTGMQAALHLERELRGAA